MLNHSPDAKKQIRKAGVSSGLRFNSRMAIDRYGGIGSPGSEAHGSLRVRTAACTKRKRWFDGAISLGAALACFVTFTSGCFAGSQPETNAKHLYVASDGNDQWSGTLPSPNSEGNDGPFRSLKRARDIIRIRKAGDKGGFTVLVRGGTYYLNETLTFGPEDSGTDSNPLIFRAYPKEHAVLSGARAVNNFRPYSEQIVRAALKDIPLAPDHFRQLFANGKRQTLARFPNSDLLNPKKGGFLYVGEQVNRWSKTKFKYTRGSVHHWPRPIGAEVVIYAGPNYWNNTIPVSNIDTGQRIVTLAGDASYPLVPGNRYYFQNLLEELDAPGEWYFDEKEKELYFWPPDETSRRTVSVPALKSILEIKEKNYFGRYKAAPAYIRFEGFTLEGCDGDAVAVRKAKHTIIAGCTIRNAGGNGIALEDGQGNAAIGNDIYDVGGQGIVISGGDYRTLEPGGNVAMNNYIHDVGVFDKASSGIECNGVGNVVSHNLVYSTPRIGIRFDGNDNIIEYNHVHHTNQETQDSGAIYSCARDWTKRGNVIQFNYVHDSGGYGRHRADEAWQSPFYTWGIYLDDWTSGTEVHGNIVSRANNGGIFIHGGSDNTIENNIIIESATAQMVYSLISASEKEVAAMLANVIKTGYSKYPLLSASRFAKTAAMSGNTFARNIIYYTNSKSNLYEINGKLDLAATVSDYNIIYHGGLPLLVPYTEAAANHQWMKWKGSGMDRHSVVADPMLSISTVGGIKLSPNSPALAMGFRPIPFDKIGPYKDSTRASWPPGEQSCMWRENSEE